MFSALETTWDRSARRRWTTVASFTMQALAVSMLLAIPLLTVQGPPRLGVDHVAFLRAASAGTARSTACRREAFVMRIPAES